MKRLKCFFALISLSLAVSMLLLTGCGDSGYKPLPSSTTMTGAASSSTMTEVQTTSTVAGDQTVTSDVAETTESVTETRMSVTETVTSTAAASVPTFPSDFDTSYDFFIGYDRTNDIVLYEKNADDRANPASVTKIITAMIAIENVPLDTEFTVGGEIRRTPAYSSVADLVEGEVFTLDDLLYGMILPSGNDAALTIAVNTARYLYGNELGYSDAVKKFMALCNDKLAELGCDNTHFSSPYGGTSASHYTTARDILKLSIYAMDNEKFAEVAGTVKKNTIAVTGEAHTWTNTNYLVLPSNKYYYEYATGVKNGKSESAAFCLSASAVKDGRELYAVGLHAPSLSTRYGDIKRFFEASFM